MEVGDGSRIWIWKDRWLPLQNGGKPWSPIRVLDDDTNINQLSDPGSSRWSVPEVGPYKLNTEAVTYDDEIAGFGKVFAMPLETLCLLP
ncbi:hypothetical protein GH714_004512 [Hevea brasiliensis]|uniref:Uncharacterized protein n=1 Tax=Hevea brasiliensis TaxID=3981 RepID=A0A6A6M8U4_HEVBR|nr:hypothetical protein GH714_004512 [Hevea brasiliensis]